MATYLEDCLERISGLPAEIKRYMDYIHACDIRRVAAMKVSRCFFLFPPTKDNLVFTTEEVYIVL